jgi:hypothetical protein
MCQLDWATDTQTFGYALLQVCLWGCFCMRLTCKFLVWVKEIALPSVVRSHPVSWRPEWEITPPAWLPSVKNPLSGSQGCWPMDRNYIYSIGCPGFQLVNCSSQDLWVFIIMWPIPKINPSSHTSCWFWFSRKPLLIQLYILQCY